MNTTSHNIDEARAKLPPLLAAKKEGHLSDLVGQFIDPRTGDLFAVIEQLEKKSGESE
jgi:hypothetical protein